MGEGEVKVFDSHIGAPIIEETSSLKRLHKGAPTVTFEIVNLRTSWVALALELLPYAAILVSVHLILAAATKGADAHSQFFWKVVEPISLLLRVCIFAELFRRYFDRLYKLTCERITAYYGKLSLNLQVAHIQYGDIREIRIEQGVLGRIFNFGSLKLSTASTNEYEVILTNIDNPKSVMQEVNQRRKKITKHDKNSSRDD